MKRYFFALALVLLPLPVSALGVREVSQSIAEKGFRLDVSSKGIAINFLKVGEQVTFVDISHKRDFVVYGDGALCVGNQGCSGAPVSILFLRRIKPLSFDGVIPASDGLTHLFVKTGSSKGSALYQFAINPVSSSGYSVVEIVEDQPKVAFTPQPRIPRPIQRPLRLPPPVRSEPQIKINLQPTVTETQKDKGEEAVRDQSPNKVRKKPRVEPLPEPEIRINLKPSVKEDVDGTEKQPIKLEKEDDTPNAKQSKSDELDTLTQSELNPTEDGKTLEEILKDPFPTPPDTTPLERPFVPTHMRYANAIARGMAKDPVTKWDWEWRQINTAIRILRRGGSLPTASKRSGLAKERLYELIDLGGVTPR